MYKFKIMCLLPVFIAALCVSTFTNLSNCYASVEEQDYLLGYGGLEYDNEITAEWSDPSMVELAYEDGIYKVTFIKEGDVSVTFGYGEDEPMTLICHIKRPETHTYIAKVEHNPSQDFLNEVNTLRNKNGLNPLTISKALTDGAKARAIEIHTNKSYTSRPDGRPFYTVMAPAEYEGRTIYEFNASIGAISDYYGGPNSLIDHLLTKGSLSGFREKVLNNPNVTEIGIATYDDYDSTRDSHSYTDVIFAR